MKAYLFAALIFSQFSVASTAQNQKLSDLMLLLSDQMLSVIDLAKKIPEDVEAPVFVRNASRCRGAALLLAVAIEKAGTVVDGQLQAGDLTPAKLQTLSGAELTLAFQRYGELLSDAQSKFNGIEQIIQYQAALPPEDRNFKDLKIALAKLDDAMKKAHQEFAPSF